MNRVHRPVGHLLAAAVLASCGGPGVSPADLILTNGVVVTVDPQVPNGEAVAIADGRIVAVGSSSEIERYTGPATVVEDLEGAFAMPGFIESHGHFMGIGASQLQLDLMDAATWQDIVASVEDAVSRSRPGELILGRGWHQEKWDRPPDEHVDGIPVHTSLSAVSPENPVVLTHASGHATFANAQAMEAAGVDASTPDPQGGEIVRDAAGRPVGMFRERASGLLGPAMAGAAAPDPERVAELAAEEVLSKGITSFQDAGSGFETVDLLKGMVDRGTMPVRLWIMIRASNEELAANLAAYRTVGYGDDHLTVRAIKRSIDGALGSHGAWLLEPYADFPTSSGLNTAGVEDVRETARLAAEHDYQLCVHAIGDRANREVLDIFEATFATHPDEEDWRWRIEHAQHLHPDDIPRFASLGVIAAMQGIHATSDAPYVFERLGPRRAEEGAYVWQKLIEAGVVIANGTDAPVEDVDPIASYYATVSRRVRDGSVFFADQRMSRTEALESYTINAAFAANEDDIKGSLTPGKLADITVLSQDLLTVDEARIPDTEVVMTIVGGEVQYRR